MKTLLAEQLRKHFGEAFILNERVNQFMEECYSGLQQLYSMPSAEPECKEATVLQFKQAVARITDEHRDGCHQRRRNYAGVAFEIRPPAH